MLGIPRSRRVQITVSARVYDLLLEEGRREHLDEGREVAAIVGRLARIEAARLREEQGE